MGRTDQKKLVYRDLLFTPFTDGGRDPEKGLDCYGLFQEIQRRLGRAVPDFAVSCFNAPLIEATAALEIEAGRWARTEEPGLGDAVALALDPDVPDMVQHFGVMLDGRRFIHTTMGRGVHVVELNGSLAARFYEKRIKGFFRWAA